jgi:hypothetical protein
MPELVLRSKARWGSNREKGDQHISAHLPEQKSPGHSMNALPVDSEPAVIAQGFNGHMAYPPIERAIAPVEELDRTIASFEYASYPSSMQAPKDHPRHGPTEFLGLPAPPRKIRSPLLHLPDIGSSGPPVQAAIRSSIDPHLSKQTSYYTLGKPDSPSPTLSVEWSSSSFCSTQSDDRFMTSGTLTRPMLSAFHSRYPSIPPRPAPPHHTRSLPVIPQGEV